MPENSIISKFVIFPGISSAKRATCEKTEFRWNIKGVDGNWYFSSTSPPRKLGTEWHISKNFGRSGRERKREQRREISRLPDVHYIWKLLSPDLVQSSDWTGFHFTLMFLGKMWIYQFSPQLWINNWVDWVLQPCFGNQSRKRRLWVETSFTQLKTWLCVTSYP